MHRERSLRTYTLNLQREKMKKTMSNKMAEKKIKLEMYRVRGGAPFVKVDYMDKEANEHSALMLLDSGSDTNILSHEMMGCINNQNIVDGKTTDVVDATGEILKANNVLFSFVMGSVQFQDEFCITDQKLPEVLGGLPFIGILGNLFMINNNLAIDYCDNTVHTSDVTPENLCISDCEFFFPMELGIRYYNLPVISMRQNGNEIVALADTGASDNIISIQSLTDKGFCVEDQHNIQNMTGIFGNMDTKTIAMDFTLLNIMEDKNVEQPHKDFFQVVPHPVYIPNEKQVDADGNPLEPIDAIVGSGFMEQQGWTLDFGAGIIYKRKIA